jgi:hypothetical protein
VVGDGRHSVPAERRQGCIEVGRTGQYDLEHVLLETRLQLCGGPGRHGPPAIDDDDGVGQTVGFFEVLGRQHHRRPIVADGPDLFPQRAATAGIEAGRGLVQEDGRWVRDEGGHEVEPSPLPAGQRLRRPARVVGHVEALEQLFDPCPALRSGQVVEPSEKVQVLPRAELVVEGGTLPGQADAASDHPGVGADVEAGHARTAAICRQQGREQLDGRGLARAVGTEQPEDRSGSDREAQSIDRDRFAEALAQAVGHDDRHLARRSGLVVS